MGHNFTIYPHTETKGSNNFFQKDAVQLPSFAKLLISLKDFFKLLLSEMKLILFKCLAHMILD